MRLSMQCDLSGARARSAERAWCLIPFSHPKGSGSETAGALPYSSPRCSTNTIPPMQRQQGHGSSAAGGGLRVKTNFGVLTLSQKTLQQGQSARERRNKARTASDGTKLTQLLPVPPMRSTSRHRKAPRVSRTLAPVPKTPSRRHRPARRRIKHVQAREPKRASVAAGARDEDDTDSMLTVRAPRDRLPILWFSGRRRSNGRGSRGASAAEIGTSAFFSARSHQPLVATSVQRGCCRDFVRGVHDLLSTTAPQND